MRRKGTLAALLALGIAVALAAPAAAQTTGNETFKAMVVASGASGERQVVSSVVIAKGVFSGVGRIVEIQNFPGDPDNLLRDDFVFADGSIHIVSVSLDATFSLNPHSCTYGLTVQQTGMAVGGTGRFAAATGSFAGTVTARGVLARSADGSCSFEQAALHDVDMITSSGSLSF